MENQLVVFDMADEFYGIDIAGVEGIIKMQAITAVPRAPAFVEGVTNLRGNVVPVIDLRRRFGIPAGEETKDTRIVVVEVGDTTIGMIVDGVSEVLRIDDEVIDPPSPIVASIDSTFITGIAKVDNADGVGGRLIILLDLVKAFSLDEQAALMAM